MYGILNYKNIFDWFWRGDKICKLHFTSLSHFTLFHLWPRSEEHWTLHRAPPVLSLCVDICRYPGYLISETVVLQYPPLSLYLVLFRLRLSLFLLLLTSWQSSSRPVSSPSPVTEQDSSTAHSPLSRSRSPAGRTKSWLTNTLSTRVFSLNFELSFET